MFTDYDLKSMRAEWVSNPNVGRETERVLHQYGYISPCEYEFGPHDKHSECEWLMLAMNGDNYYDETDYSAWYGGERGYQDGLRWSDFI